MNSDYLVRATAAEGQIRAFAVRTTELVNEAQQRHHTFPVASAALGRTMTIGVVMGAMLKSEEQLTLQVKGNGPLNGVLVVADSQGNVRGYVGNPYVDLPLNSQGKLAVGDAIGAGVLNVIRDMGLKEPYQGVVPLQTGEIGDDFAYYFASSEQKPSVVSLGVLVNPDGSIAAAGGYVIQLMPGATEELISRLEQRIPTIPTISTLIKDGKSPEDVLNLILGDMNLEIKDRRNVQFACACSHERMEANLITLGAEELRNLLDDQGDLELVCHFCGEKYQFSKLEVAELVKQITK